MVYNICMWDVVGWREGERAAGRATDTRLTGSHTREKRGYAKARIRESECIK
jgi:hypothetical protein